jgi:hypothetical protein
MSKFIIMGSTPGDGGCVEAETLYKALMQFFNVTEEEVGAAFSGAPEKVGEREWRLGDYEIRKVG